MAVQQEVVSGRTLTIRGAKKVIRNIQRKNATTHSYTVHVTLNSGGFLAPKLPIVLYEPGKQGPPQDFQAQVEEFANLHVYWSSSGWMTSDIAVKWMVDIFLPMIENDSVLIIDAWKGFTEMKKHPELQAKNLSIHTLPEGSTSQLQPADVYFNRTFKHFIRICSDKIRRRHPEFTLAIRKNILILLDLVYNQFKSPRFKQFLLYSWYKSGYFAERPEEFQTPIQYCLRYLAYLKCETDFCNHHCFMRCSYCELHFCFEHILHHRH